LFFAGSMSPWGTEPAAGNHHVRQCLRLAQLDRYRSILGDVPLETICKGGRVERNFFVELVEKPTDTKTSRCFVIAADARCSSVS
jgi:hypothetical protein